MTTRVVVERLFQSILQGRIAYQQIRDQNYIALFFMKRSCSSHGSDKSLQAVSKKDKKYVNFDYTNNLQCFITSSSQLSNKHMSKKTSREQKLKTNPTELTSNQPKDNQNPLLTLRVPRKYKGRVTQNSQNTFSNKVLLLQYQREQENVPQSKVQLGEKGKNSPKSEEEDQAVTQLVNSCIKVITQETQHSSNPLSARFTPLQNSTPMANSMTVQMMMQMFPEEYYYYMQRTPAVRNRRAISTEESKDYWIDIDRVETDGRTTIMVRNIPNKYTQDMLLQLFEKNHKKKFDFFYLPIDYNNNCNVGYAFLNFIHTKFIADFYKDFHQRKWNKFNSVKVCQVCYARIQGTAQLQNHFEHSNVLQQRDRRYRPLIGIKTLQENISHLLQKQKGEQSGDSDES